MRFALMAGLLASLTIVPAAQAGWVLHSEPGLGFQANFPATPTRQESTEDGVKMTTFAGVANGVMCLIVAANYGYTIKPDEETVASRDNFAKGVSATISKSERIKFPRGATQLEAIKFDAASAKYSFRSLIVIDGTWAFQIAGGVPKPDGDDAELDACVGGLVLLPK